MLVAFPDSCGGARAQLLGREDLTRVLRLALVRMPPGARLNLRADRDGFSLYRCRRGSHLHSNCNFCQTAAAVLTHITGALMP